MLNKLKEKLFKCNIERLLFGQTEIWYLGFWVTQYGVKPTNINIEAITNINPTSSQKQVLQFIGVVNDYRDMWPRRSHMLSPLTRITPNKGKFKWAGVKQYYFYEIKRTIYRDTLITYPDLMKHWKFTPILARSN